MNSTILTRRSEKTLADRAYDALRECGGPPHLYVDAILKAAGVPADKIASVLEELENAGRIEHRVSGFSVNLGSGKWVRGSRVRRGRVV